MIKRMEHGGHRDAEYGGAYKGVRRCLLFMPFRLFYHFFFLLLFQIIPGLLASGFCA